MNTQEAKQQLFDRAVAGLARQGFQQSFDEAQDTCAYRGSEGMRCAMGHVLPDDKYQPEFEGKNAKDLMISHTVGDEPELTVYDLLQVPVSEARQVDEHEIIDFLYELQQCHDSHLSMSAGGMRRQLQWLADEHGLRRPAELD